MISSSSSPVEAIDIRSSRDVRQLITQWKPDGVFYLAAVHGSSQQNDSDEAELLSDSLSINVAGLGNFLEPAREVGVRIFYAATSMVFGESHAVMQTEKSALRPRTVYAITKATGLELCRYYRARGTAASCGILFNHESPLRKPHYVSQKIARGAVDIARGRLDKLVLGNLAARVDWGYANDFVDAMIRIAESPKADDYIVATGETHSVAEFAEIAFSAVQLDWRDHVTESTAILSRINHPLCGDASKLRKKTEWRPSVSFAEMVTLLVRAAEEKP